MREIWKNMRFFFKSEKFAADKATFSANLSKSCKEENISVDSGVFYALRRKEVPKYWLPVLNRSQSRKVSQYLTNRRLQGWAVLKQCFKTVR